MHSIALKGNNMKIIIVGCGKVGTALAGELSKDGNSISVIDTNADRVNDIANKYDAMGIVGDGLDHLTLKEADVEHADLFIAMTGSDEQNLLCCLMAKKTGNCQTIARVRSPRYSKEAPFIKDELGLAMVINPEYAAAAEIARILRFPSAIKIDTFARGRIELLKFRLPEDSPLVGLAVKDIVSKLHCNVLICTVERGEEAYIANGDFVFESKDIISIIAPHKSANEFFKKIDYKTLSAKNVIIAGGGNISHYLCKTLSRSSNISVKVIERKLERCKELSSELETTTVIHGDASDKALLLEEGLENADGFVALTNLDEENIFLSLFAKQVGNAKAITKINRIDFDEVISRLDLDTTIYPKNITTETIVRYVRAAQNAIGSNVETLYNVVKDKIEAAEFIVKKGSIITGIQLSMLKFKPNVLIAAILRNGQIIVPRGSDMLQPGDSVIIVSDILGMKDITDILR